MKLKTNIVRNGNSLYLLLPNKLTKELGLKDKDVILAEITKYHPVWQRVCEDAKQRDKEVEVSYGKDKKIKGKILEITQEYLNILDEGKNMNHMIHLSLITQII